MVTLVEELPFAFAVEAECIHTTCSFCFFYGRSVQKCIGCYSVSYCNKECQKSDWVNHKKECRLLKKWKSGNSVVPKANARLTCRMLLKSEKELAQVGFNGRTWNCLMDHAAETKSTNDEYSKYFEEQIADIKLFLKPAKDVSQEEVEKALSKVLTNAFSLTDMLGGCNQLGRAVYLGLSVHDHNCFPDAHFVSIGNKGILRSTDPNTVYSPNITVSYLSRTPFRLGRQISLKGLYHFECSCPLCSEEDFIMNRMGVSCYVDCCKDAAGLESRTSPGIYECNRCGKVSSIHQCQIFTAHLRICTFIDERGKSSNDKRSFIISGMNLLKEFKAVLSMYNVCVLDLCAAIRRAALDTGNVEIHQRVCDDLEKPYEYYLPIEEGERHQMSVVAAFWTTDERRVARISKVVEETRVIYGEEHPLTKTVEKMSEDPLAVPISFSRP